MKFNPATYSDFYTNGFSIIKLENLEPINRMRLRLEENITDFLLSNLKVKPDYLENNKLSDNDYSNLLQQINELNINLNDFKIVSDNLESLFKPVLGENIACAKTPRIRFVQKEESRVAFGMHSDTFYGDSFFDIAIWMQLTPDTSTPSLKVIPGSHIPFQGKYTVKDGEKNWDSKFIKAKNIGLAYDPKVVDYDPASAIDLVIPYGSVLIFFASLLHATYPHSSNIPRLSADCRLTPLLLPPQFRKNKPGYWQPLYVTEITQRILDCYPTSIDEIL